MSNFSSMDGFLYCKTHFEQLFKESENFSKNFQTDKLGRENYLTRAPCKLSGLSTSTQDKCPACNKIVYPLREGDYGGRIIPQVMFQVCLWVCPLAHPSYAALDGIIYCKVYLQQLFMEKGNYQHVLNAVTDRKSVVGPVEPESEATEQSNEEVDMKEEMVDEAEVEKEQEQS